MPCSDGNYGGTVYVDNPETMKRLDKVTRLLCGLCKTLTQSGLSKHIEADRELFKWWFDHQEVDRRRKEAEEKEAEKNRKLRVALDKLTDEEKKLLGII